MPPGINPSVWYFFVVPFFVKGWRNTAKKGGLHHVGILYTPIWLCVERTKRSAEIVESALFSCDFVKFMI